MVIFVIPSLLVTGSISPRSKEGRLGAGPLPANKLPIAASELLSTST